MLCQLVFVFICAFYILYDILIFIYASLLLCRYDLTETCVSAAKRPSVRPRLEGEMSKTIRFWRNVQGVNRPRVCGESCRRRNVQGWTVQGAKRPGGETSKQGAKRRGGETSIKPHHWYPLRKDLITTATTKIKIRTLTFLLITRVAKSNLIHQISQKNSKVFYSEQKM